MTAPISSSTRLNTSTFINSSKASSSKSKISFSKPKNLGISSGKTTIQSMQSNKVSFSKHMIIAIKNILKAIIYGIRDVFLCIFPFKNIFLKKEKISLTEKKYFDYQRKLYRVDSLSINLAQSEAEALLPHFNAFERLGEIELRKRQSKSFISSFMKRNETWLPDFIKTKEPTIEEKIKIGKEEAKKDLKLIAVLKEYYMQQISMLENELKKEKKSD